MAITRHFAKQVILQWILPLFILSSCVMDDKEVETEPSGQSDSRITFSLQLPNASTPSTRALTDTDENDVSQVDVLVFKPGGGEYVYSARCSGTDITTDQLNSRKKTFTVRLRQGNFDIVVLANARTALNAATLTGKTKAEALEALTDAMPSNGKWVADNGESGYRPFPMWGNIGNIAINDQTDLTDDNAVKLTRMVARIDVQVSGTAVSTFALSSVYVYNYNDQGTLVPDATLWDTSDADAPKVTAPTVPASAALTEGPLLYDGTAINTTANKCEKEIYIFEAENHSDAAHATPKGLTSRTCLVVGGSYNGETESYYRVDFSTGTGQSQVYMDILRNHKYIVNINSVSGPGYGSPDIAFRSGPVNIQAEVLQWNDANIGDIKFDGQYYLGVSQGEFDLTRQARSTAGIDNVLTIRTDVPTGWTATVRNDLAGQTPVANDAVSGSPWLRISPTSGTGSGTGDEMILAMDANTESDRTAYIHIVAGRLTYIVRVTQTIMSPFYIAVVPDVATIDFPSGITQTIDPFTLDLEWEPSTENLTWDIKQISGGGLVFSMPPGGQLPGGTAQFTLEPDPMDPLELAGNPFAERISRIEFALEDGIGGLKTKLIVLRQMNFAAQATAKSWYLIGQQNETITVYANTPWTAELISGNAVSAIVTGSGGGNSTTGEPLTFTMADGSTLSASNYAGSSVIRISSPTSLFDPIDLTIAGEYGYVFYSSNGKIKYLAESVDRGPSIFGNAAAYCPTGYSLPDATIGARMGRGGVPLNDGRNYWTSIGVANLPSGGTGYAVSQFNYTATAFSSTATNGSIVYATGYAMRYPWGYPLSDANVSGYSWIPTSWNWIADDRSEYFFNRTVSGVMYHYYPSVRMPYHLRTRTEGSHGYGPVGSYVGTITDVGHWDCPAPVPVNNTAYVRCYKQLEP